MDDSPLPRAREARRGVSPGPLTEFWVCHRATNLSFLTRLQLLISFSNSPTPAPPRYFRSTRSKPTQPACALRCTRVQLPSYAALPVPLRRLQFRRRTNHPCTAPCSRTKFLSLPPLHPVSLDPSAKRLRASRSPSRWTTPLRPKPFCRRLLHFLVRRVLAARIAKLLRLQTVGVLLFVFCRCVVAVFAISALQRNGFPHRFISLFQSLFIALLNNLRYGAGAHGVAAFANGKA